MFRKCFFTSSLKFLNVVYLAVALQSKVGYLSVDAPNLCPVSTDSFVGLVPISCLVTAITYTAAFEASMVACVTASVIPCASAIFCVHFCQLWKCLLVCIFLAIYMKFDLLRSSLIFSLRLPYLSLRCCDCLSLHSWDFYFCHCVMLLALSNTILVMMNIFIFCAHLLIQTVYMWWTGIYTRCLYLSTLFLNNNWTLIG